MADAVIDIEALGGGESDAGADGAGDGSQGQDNAHGQDNAAQQRQADKEYRDWLKSRKDDGEDGKFYRRTKDNDARLQALLKLEPKGIDGVKSHYETLNGIAHGEKTGIEAVQSIQEALAESQTILDAVAQGNMDSLSEEQRDGIYRMAPSVLEDLAESNPDAYSALLAATLCRRPQVERALFLAERPFGYAQPEAALMAHERADSAMDLGARAERHRPCTEDGPMVPSARSARQGTRRQRWPTSSAG